MLVRNVHLRRIRAPLAKAGALIDALATPADRLWPVEWWPAMRLDRPLGVGAAGGHGPIRYVIEEYESGRRVRFRFTAPRGFEGGHEFDVESSGEEESLLVHRLVMDARGLTALSWQLVYRPLHDALIEDALSKAERELTGLSSRRRWSPVVRILRRLMRKRRRHQ